MKNFTMQQLFAMNNEMDDKSYVFAKGVADGKEAYAFVLDKGIYQSTTKEEMTEIFIALQKEGWKYGTTMDVVDIPILGKAPAENLKAPKEPKRRRSAKAKVEKTVSPAEPKKKVPPMWLFPKKVGRKTKYSAEYFDYEAYKAKAIELGLWNGQKAYNRDKVYEALGAKKNPERIAYDKAKGVK